MKLTRTLRFQPGFVFLAPVLDIGFVLGLFVVLSTPFLLQPGISVEVPRSPFLLAPQQRPQVVSITGPPRRAVYFENLRVSMEELRGFLEGSAQPGTIVIKADREASYEMVVEVATVALELGIPVVFATEPEQ